MSKKEACCPVEVTLKVIGERCKVLIIHSLLNGMVRFNQLQRDLTGITHRALSRQLREMEADQLIIRNNFNEIPPRVEYSLSPLGYSLKTILYTMDEWGKIMMLEANKSNYFQRIKMHQPHSIHLRYIVPLQIAYFQDYQHNRKTS